MTWQQAQVEQRKTGWGNLVVAPDEEAMIGGNEDRGFFILLRSVCVFAKTEHGVQLLLQEFALPTFGWT